MLSSPLARRGFRSETEAADWDCCCVRRAATHGDPQVGDSLSRGLLDQRFLRLSAVIPGFAGFYLSEQIPQHIIVRLTDLGQRSASEAHLEESLRELKYDDSRTLADLPREFLAADYDFRSLDRWRTAFAPSVRLGGVTSLDVDELANRLRIGVLDQATSDHVVALLPTLNIPRAAVRIVIEPHPRQH